jgi:hypothetical protein
VEQRERLIELKKDLTDIFDEEYYRRNLITPQNTAEKLAEKGYRKQSEVAREIFEELDDMPKHHPSYVLYTLLTKKIAELKKKYMEVEK